MTAGFLACGEGKPGGHRPPLQCKAVCTARISTLGRFLELQFEAEKSGHRLVGEAHFVAVHQVALSIDDFNDHALFAAVSLVRSRGENVVSNFETRCSCT